MKAGRFFETSVMAHHTTQRHILGVLNPLLHRCENLKKTHIDVALFVWGSTGHLNNGLLSCVVKRPNWGVRQSRVICVFKLLRPYHIKIHFH